MNGKMRIRKIWNKVVHRLFYYCIMVLFMTLLFGTKAVFACDVTDVELWIGDTESDAGSYNTDEVFKCAGDDFGWYVEWEADEPDEEVFEGEIWIDEEECVDEFDSDLYDERDYSGEAYIPSSMSAGDHTVTAWMHRYSSAVWECSSERDLTVSDEVYYNPIAIISYSGSENLPLGQSKSFSGSSSHDNDEYQTSITYYEWWIYDGLNWTWWYGDEYDSSCNIWFSSTGIWEVWLGVWDDENDEDWAYVEIGVFDVQITNAPNYLEQNTQFELESEEYGCFGGTFSWSKISGPGTPTFISSSSEDPTLVIAPLGIYEIMVTYTIGDVSAYDTHTIVVEMAWTPFNPGFTCPGFNCDPSVKIYTVTDDLLNEIKVLCAQEDGYGGATDCAYRNYYNDQLISSCIWSPAVNSWDYKMTVIEGDDVFTKFKHSTVKGAKITNPPNIGCIGYYCAKITILYCISGNDYVFWRRSTTTNALWLPTDGIECPGH